MASESNGSVMFSPTWPVTAMTAKMAEATCGGTCSMNATLSLRRPMVSTAPMHTRVCVG